jgi:hypothetical protein
MFRRLFSEQMGWAAEMNWSLQLLSEYLLRELSVPGFGSAYDMSMFLTMSIKSGRSSGGSSINVQWDGGRMPVIRISFMATLIGVPPLAFVPATA